MEQRERLIESIDNLQKKENVYFPLTSEDLADHLIANGVIAPPCKVGDTVYMPWEYKGVSGVAILTVTHVIIDNVHSYIRTNLENDCKEYWLAYNCGRFDFREFGEKVFTSRQEAAQALEKLIAERSEDESITVT